MKKNYFSSLLLFSFVIVGVHAQASLTEVHVSDISTALASGQLSRQKQTLCTMTINSSDEKIALKRNLKSDQYQVVELATDGSIDDYGSRKTDFLADACVNLKKNNLNCDQLIISTHFGNHIWGSSGLRFSIDDLEQLSCSHVCDNVLSAPKTKIAFACNMNSDDELGNRTPEQMRIDLINDGLSSRDADLAVQSVHQAAGMSFRQRNELIFFGDSELISFNRRAPKGSDMSYMIDEAFKKGMKWQTDKSDFLSVINNLYPKLGLVAMKTNVNSDLRNKVCAVIDPNKESYQKLNYFSHWLSDPNWINLFPRLVNLVIEKDFFPIQDATALNSFNTISKNQVVRGQVLGLIQTLRGPTMKHRWAFFAWRAGWLTNAEFRTIVAESIIKFLRPPFPLDYQDRQDVIDEVGWMHKRYYNETGLNILEQFTLKDIYDYYNGGPVKGETADNLLNNSRVKNFFKMDLDLISNTIRETHSSDVKLQQMVEKMSGYPW